MSLEFKKIEVNSIQEMLPFYAMRHNMTCDSVFLESYVWKDYYNVRYAIWENKALLWLMENEGRCFSAMPLCREEDLPGAFAAIEEYFNEELGYPLVINLADEYAVKYLNLPEDKYLVEEQVDSRDYLYNGDAMLLYLYAFCQSSGNVTVQRYFSVRPQSKSSRICSSYTSSGR